MCVCVCAPLHVCYRGLVISVLCQLMRDERGHLFRGAGWRTVGWDTGMGDVWGFADGTAAPCWACMMCERVEGDVCVRCYGRSMFFTYFPCLVRTPELTSQAELLRYKLLLRAFGGRFT